MARDRGSLADADAGADANLPRLSRYAPWRRRAPTVKALDAVRRLKRGVELDEAGKLVAVMIGTRRVEVRKMTAGQVASYL